jgi:hypothetical protein
MLIGLGAAAFYAFNSGLLKQWMNHSSTPPVAPPPPAVIPPEPTAPTESADQPKPNNIFDVPGSSNANVPKPTIPRPSNAVVPPPPVNVAPPEIQLPKMSVREARVKLDAAMSAVEKSLGGDAAYQQAKADADAADAQRKAAVTTYGAGSQEVLDAGNKWLDAKSKVQKIVATAAAKNPAVTAAQHDLSDAEAGNRPTKR